MTILSTVVLASTLRAQSRSIRAGSTPGTECWIAMLRGRTFSLRDRLAAIRAEPDLARRRMLLAQLDELTRADQDDFTRFAAGLSVPVVTRFWNVNACVVEVAPSRVAALRAHRHVIDLYPDEARFSGTVSAGVRSLVPSPKLPFDSAASSANGTDPANHDVATAHGLIGEGANAIVALFDSRVDLDQNGTGVSPDPNVHNAFRDTAGSSRVIANVLVGTIDCNTTTTTPPVDPYCSLGANYPDARHGTGVAGIAIGTIDPLLARYARRFDSALAQSVTLTTQSPTVDVTYTGLTAEQHYAVAIAWPRPITDDASTHPWANVDLEVRSSGGTVLLARSDSLRNTYERLVFKATGTSALVRVIGTDLLGQTVPVFVAARSIGMDGTIESHRSIPGYVARIAQEPACSATVPDQRIRRVLPSLYKDAYGSHGVANFVLPITSAEAHRGFILSTSATPRPIGLVFRENMTDGAPYTVRALTFRAFNPLPSCATTLTFVSIYMAMGLPGAQAPPTSSTGMQLVATNVSVPVVASQWNARGPNTWPIIVRLDTPFTVTAGSSLQMWMQVSSSPDCTFEVDCTIDPLGGTDPPWQDYASSLGPVFYDGIVPILGFIEEGALLTPPDLFAYGFPVIGRHLLFQVRQAGAGNPAWVVLGSSNPNALLGSCRILTNGDLGTLGPITTATLGHGNVPYQVPNNSALMHQHVFAQAIVQAGSSFLYSNGLRLTIGGVLP